MEGKLHISPGFCFLTALWLLLLPPAWSIGLLCAATVHELFHFLAVYSCGEKVISVSLMALGARIDTTPLTPGREALCALAGPLGSYSFLLLSERFPEAAVCGFLQGSYNLLPIYPLDGGRVLRCLFPDVLCKAIEAFFLTVMSGIGMWIALYSRDVGLFLILAVWNPVIQRKFSCKEPKQAVQ